MRYIIILLALFNLGCNEMNPVPESYRGIPLLSCEVPDQRVPNSGTCIYENDYAKAVVRHSFGDGWRMDSFQRKKFSEVQREKYNNPPDILAPPTKFNGTLHQKQPPNDLVEIIPHVENKILEEESKKNNNFESEDPY